MSCIRHLILVFVVVTACAPVQFDTAGNTSKFEDDRYDCELALGYRGAPRSDDMTMQLANVLVNGQSEMKRCLERKGWKAKQ